MAYFDWREAIMAEDVTQYSDNQIKVKQAEWKRSVIASYLKIPPEPPKVIPGLIPAALGVAAFIGKILFGHKTLPKDEYLDIDIGPEEAALVIKDGQILDIYSQKRLLKKGFIEWLKSLVGVDHSYRILFVDLSPFEFDIKLDDLTAQEFEKIGGSAYIRMQIISDKLQDLLGLLAGRNLLHVDDIKKTVETHLKSRVFVPEISKRKALDLRTDVRFQDQLQAQCGQEIERYYGDLGIMLKSLVIDWKKSGAELSAIAQKQRKDREDLEAEEIERKKRTVGRVHAYDEAVSEITYEQKKKKIARDHELAKLEYELKEKEDLEHEKKRQLPCHDPFLEGSFPEP